MEGAHPKPRRLRRASEILPILLSQTPHLFEPTSVGTATDITDDADLVARPRVQPERAEVGWHRVPANGGTPREPAANRRRNVQSIPARRGRAL